VTIKVKLLHGFFTLACLAGCGEQGPQRAAVNGSVSFDGNLIPDGQIAFIPTAETKGPSAAGIIKDGKYAIEVSKGSAIGKHRVEIRAERKTGRIYSAEDTERNMGAVEDFEPYIPVKYNRESTLTVDISPGDNNDVDFDLTR